MEAIKRQLKEACERFVNKRLETVSKVMSSGRDSLNSETKSSAGDKHETGRAMIQLEMEKAGQQLQNIQAMQTTLNKIGLDSSDVARLGSLVHTNKGQYYLSISAGSLHIADQNYFAVSLSSPIGKLLLGKRAGDTEILNGMSIKITAVF
ncbi:3-oxoacyl-ACP synthase [Tenacibaculum litopenaei]|uniref:3-oxoacyl-ACP synthase n=1 Tax=Tenacibaculum litopenaei TaxID=396016 RepID=UPI003892DA20